MGQRFVPIGETDVALREDVGLVGALVGELLRDEGGEQLFELVETVRLAAIARRQGEIDAEDRLISTLEELKPDSVQDLVRAFVAYFHVVNLAERVHRVRRLREYQRDGHLAIPGSLREVFGNLHNAGVELDDLVATLGELRLEPVFTAHPTESTRRTLLEKERTIAEALIERIDRDLILERQRDSLERMREAIGTAWETELISGVRPRVEDEMEHVLYYLTDVLYEVLPRFNDALREALVLTYGESAAGVQLPLILGFGSWVGGDMDGNPNVDADSIRRALTVHRRLAIGCYLPEVRNLGRLLSQTEGRIGISEAVAHRKDRYLAQLDADGKLIPPRHRNMPYRCLLRLMQDRLERCRDDRAGGYGNSAEFLSDLQQIRVSLEEHSGRHAGLKSLRRLQQRLRTFGFHMAALDVRQDALVHRRVVGQLLADEKWLDRSADERHQRLIQALTDGERPDWSGGGEVQACLDVFVAIAEARESHGSSAVGNYIISMTEGSDDLLTVLWLANVAGLTSKGSVPLDVVPLLETVEDLDAGPEILTTLLADTLYREHLRQRRDRQQIMIGYSDSNKDGGIAAARWALHTAQENLTRVAADNQVKVTFFHGRGGTVSRGGGNTRDGILSAPAGSVQGRLRVTEQGEVINQKFGIAEVAVRNLEIVTGAVLRATLKPPPPPRSEERWRHMMSGIAQASRESFRGLVYDTPEFLEFFRSATPIDVIERLAIGSRPASRRSQNGVENLRAIPWVFAWAQTRCGLPGSYGLGSALDQAAEQHGRAALVDMLAGWRFFSCMLNDVEMVLAKSDLAITARYAELADPGCRFVFDRICQEFRRTEDWILELKGTQYLLEEEPVLSRAIELRNPYVDPMSLLQINLLRVWRAGGCKDGELLRGLFATVNGIAQGIQNTG
jgi:phosphoenolpyruvate carboxylase